VTAEKVQLFKETIFSISEIFMNDNYFWKACIIANAPISVLIAIFPRLNSPVKALRRPHPNVLGFPLAEMRSSLK
jgi:hypothetical protein